MLLTDGRSSAVAMCMMICGTRSPCVSSAVQQCASAKWQRCEAALLCRIGRVGRGGEEVGGAHVCLGRLLGDELVARELALDRAHAELLELVRLLRVAAQSGDAVLVLLLEERGEDGAADETGAEDEERFGGHAVRVDGAVEQRWCERGGARGARRVRAMMQSLGRAGERVGKRGEADSPRSKFSATGSSARS